MYPDADEYRRIGEKTEIFPVSFEGISPWRGNSPERTYVAYEKPGCQAREYARKMKLFGKKKGSICGYCGKGEFDEMVFRPSGEQ